MSGFPVSRLPQAKPLTPQEASEAAEVAISIEKRVKTHMRAGREAMWDLAEALYDFDEAFGWLALGHENVSQWLARPQIDMTRSTYYRLTGAWRQLVVYRGVDRAELAGLDVTKVDTVMATIKQRRVPLKEILSDVQSKPRQQLRESYNSTETVPPAGRMGANAPEDDEAKQRQRAGQSRGGQASPNIQANRPESSKRSAGHQARDDAAKVMTLEQALEVADNASEREREEHILALWVLAAAVREGA